jgi:hypothetical protein
MNKKKNALNNSNLILISFSSVFYSRILATTIRFSLLNLVHFIFVPLLCVIALFTTRTRDQKQIKVSFALLTGLLILFGVSIASAIINSAGFINAVVSFMMLGEPFIFLLGFACVPLTQNSFNKIKNFLYGSVLINFILAAVQKPLIDGGRLDAGNLNGTDGCGGVFFVSGAGNYVSATVSLMFALYVLSKDKDMPVWVKWAVLIAALWHILFSDSKQLILTFGFAWVLLILLNSKNLLKTLKLVIGLALVGTIGLWLVQNVPAFQAYTAWARPELYGPKGLAWYAKFYSVNMILEHYQSPLNWLVGLGPGHTVSRLGAWFLRDYASILSPLGSTRTDIGQLSSDFIAGFWLTSGSSLFSPIFGWAGIWGDLGILGIGAYLYLGFLVWKYFATDDVTKVMLLSVFIIGFIFTQMEEPGYVISLAMIVGVGWHKERLDKKQKNERRLSDLVPYGE